MQLRLISGLEYGPMQIVLYDLVGLLITSPFKTLEPGLDSGTMVVMFRQEHAHIRTTL